jgi:mannose-6-phosphate isomerase-like protein (cupin superfamily)
VGDLLKDNRKTVGTGAVKTACAAWDIEHSASRDQSKPEPKAAGRSVSCSGPVTPANRLQTGLKSKFSVSGFRFDMNPIQIPESGGKKVNVLGIPMAIRIHGRDTNGVVSAVESHDVTNGGPPLHIHHREDETFQILEGEYEWTVGAKKFTASKGTTIFAPRGIPHTYRYVGKTPGRLMCVITPSGFEGFFEEVDALSPQQQQEIPRVIEIAKKYGLELPGPAGN